MFPFLSSPRATPNPERYSVASSYDSHPFLPQESEDRAFLKHSVDTIAMLNRKQHDWDVCACEECIYGRQLNRKHLIRLDLSKKSMYRQSYDNKHMRAVDNSKVNYEHIKSKPTQVEMSSVYNSEYPSGRAQEKIIKMHPQDQLRFKGPLKNYSSYGEQYPCFKGNANPYVKPNEVMLPNLMKLDTRTTYHQNYAATGKSSPGDSAKMPDHFKGGQPWTGSSTYQDLYRLPTTTKTQAQGEKDSLKGNSSLSYNHQYETTYRNEYAIERKERCKRKSLLESAGSKLMQSTINV